AVEEEGLAGLTAYPLAGRRPRGYGDRAMAERRSKRTEPGGATASSEPAEPSSKSDAAEPATASTSGNRVNIGPLSLNAPAEWRFYPLEDRIVGRHSSRVGVLQ